MQKASASPNLICEQSPDIALGVDENKGKGKEQGAGDQGMMFGYACDETPELMPAPIMFSHRIMRRLEAVRKSGACTWLHPDAKCQVTVEYDYAGKPCSISAVVLSTQHSPDVTREEIERTCIEVIKASLPASLLSPATQFLINPTGRFVTGGPQADCGLTGRKMIGRYLRRRRAAWRGRILRQRRQQGRPQRSLHVQVGCQTHRSRRAGQALRGSGELCHRKSRACLCRGAEQL